MVIISVAIDAQGPGKVGQYIEKFGVTFPTLIDEYNTLSRIFGFKAVPNGLFIDENGRLVYKQFGGFDIRNTDFKTILDSWVVSRSLNELVQKPSPQILKASHDKATDLFHDGMKLYEEGHISDALVSWRKALHFEPDNYVIRKQIWAIENPEKFYQGEVDYTWQKDQINKGI